MASENVEVAVVVRPFTDKELSSNCSCVVYTNADEVRVRNPESNKEKAFTFDHTVRFLRYFCHPAYTLFACCFPPAVISWTAWAFVHFMVLSANVLLLFCRSSVLVRRRRQREFCLAKSGTQAPLASQYYLTCSCSLKGKKISEPRIVVCDSLIFAVITRANSGKTISSSSFAWMVCYFINIELTFNIYCI